MVEWLAELFMGVVCLVIGGALTALAIVVVYGPIALLVKLSDWLDYRRAYRRALRDGQDTDQPD
jgi:hypothetical protein